MAAAGANLSRISHQLVKSVSIWLLNGSFVSLISTANSGEKLEKSATNDDFEPLFQRLISIFLKKNSLLEKSNKNF